MLTEYMLDFNSWLSQLSASYPLGVYVVIFCIIFLETAFLPVAPFLPGDGLLFLTGILASTGSISFWIAVITLIVGGSIGNLVAYKLGVWLTPKNGKKIRWVKAQHYAKAQAFYNKYGVNALFYSRFIPVVRSIVPLVAGIALMNYKTFLKYSTASVSLWVLVITTAAYYLGHIPWVKQHFTILILVFTVASTLPIFMMWINIKLLHMKTKA